MKKLMTVLVLAAVVLVVASVYRASEAEQARGPATVKIAVVNVTQVLTECQANVDLDAHLNAMKEQISAELAQLSQEAQAIQEELENALTPGSAAYDKRLLEWFEKLASREAKEKGQNEVLKSRSQGVLEKVYQALMVEVASVAQQEGVTLVLDKNDTPVRTRNLTDLYNVIRDRKVLYSTAEMDLTGRVLEGMNRAYQAEKSKP